MKNFENREQLTKQLETWRTQLKERGQSVRERIFVGPALRILEQVTKLLSKIDNETLKNTLAELYGIQRLSPVDQSLGIIPGGGRVEGKVHRRLLFLLVNLLLLVQLAGCGESGAEVVGDTGDISDTGYEKNPVVMVTEQSPDAMPPAGAIDGAEGIAPPEPPKLGETIIKEPEATIAETPTPIILNPEAMGGIYTIEQSETFVSMNNIMYGLGYQDLYKAENFPIALMTEEGKNGIPIALLTHDQRAGIVVSTLGADIDSPFRMAETDNIGRQLLHLKVTDANLALTEAGITDHPVIKLKQEDQQWVAVDKNGNALVKMEAGQWVATKKAKELLEGETAINTVDTAQAFLQTQFEVNFPEGLPDDLKITEVTTNDQGQNVARNAKGEALAFEVSPGEWRQGALASWEVATAPENATVLLDIYRLKVTVDNDLAWKGKKPTLEVHDNVRLDAWRDAVLNNIPTQGLETGNTERADYGQTEFAPAAGQITNLEVHIFTFTDPTELPPGFVAEFKEGPDGKQNIIGRLYQQDGDTIKVFVAINSKRLASADSYWAPLVVRGALLKAGAMVTCNESTLEDHAVSDGLTYNVSEILNFRDDSLPVGLRKSNWALQDVQTNQDGSIVFTPDNKVTLMEQGEALEVNWQ